MTDNDGILCENCQQWIAKNSWVLHEHGCLRHNSYCEPCQLVIPKQSREQHQQEFHTSYECSCGELLERYLQPEHEKECSCRLVACSFCECPYQQKQLDEHMESCGSRTECCMDCKQRIMFRDLASHQCPVKEEELLCPMCVFPFKGYLELQLHIFQEHSEIASD